MEEFEMKEETPKKATAVISSPKIYMDFSNSMKKIALSRQLSAKKYSQSSSDDQHCTPLATPRIPNTKSKNLGLAKLSKQLMYPKTEQKPKPQTNLAYILKNNHTTSKPKTIENQIGSSKTEVPSSLSSSRCFPFFLGQRVNIEHQSKPSQSELRREVTPENCLLLKKNMELFSSRESLKSNMQFSSKVPLGTKLVNSLKNKQQNELKSIMLGDYFPKGFKLCKEEFNSPSTFESKVETGRNSSVKIKEATRDIKINLKSQKEVASKRDSCILEGSRTRQSGDESADVPRGLFLGKLQGQHLFLNKIRKEINDVRRHNRRYPTR